MYIKVIEYYVDILFEVIVKKYNMTNRNKQNKSSKNVHKTREESPIVMKGF